MALIDLVSTGSRRRRGNRRARLCRTSRDVSMHPHDSSESGFFSETSFNKEFVDFSRILTDQSLLISCLNQLNDSMLNKLDCSWVMDEVANKISQLLLKSEQKEAGSNAAPRSFFKQSLSYLCPLQHAFLEGLFVHLHALLWHSNLSVISCSEMNARTDATALTAHVTQQMIWSAGLKRFTGKQRRDSFAMSVRWKDQTANVGFDNCCFLLWPWRAQTATYAYSDVRDVLPSPSLRSSVRREPSFLLTSGKSGYGKTWACGWERWFTSDQPRPACRRTLRGKCGAQISAKRWNGHIAVLGDVPYAQPDLPVDLFMGTSKRSGGRTISFLAYIELPLNHMSGDSTLFLDDFDQVHAPITKIVLRRTGRSGQLEVQGKCEIRQTTSIHRGLHMLRHRAKDWSLSVSVKGSKMIVLITSRDTDTLPASMFDQVLELHKPRGDDRRALLSEIFLTRLTKCNNDDQFEKFIETITFQTRGRDWSEIMRKCRESIIEEVEESGGGGAPLNPQTMGRITKRFGETSPQDECKRLTGQGNDGIRVFGPNELASLLDNYKSGIHSGDLSPWEQRQEWAQLEAGILTAMCHSQDFLSLLRRGSEDHKEKSKREPLAGILLTGASGKGKSSIARHCAAFASSLIPTLSLLEVNCVCLVRKEIGESERAIQHVFDLARSVAPSILVLDGIENIATVRGKDNSTHGTMDRILSTLLTSLDGFQGDSRQPAVVGIAAEADWVDPALCRPGRLARTINVL